MQKLDYEPVDDDDDEDIADEEPWSLRSIVSSLVLHGVIEPLMLIGIVFLALVYVGGC